MDAAPLSAGEAFVAHATQETLGLRLAHLVGGRAGRSTRTELAAALIAIACDGPMHIGTDSKAFRDRAVRYLAHLRDPSASPLRIATIADGDLWDLFLRCAASKGPHSIRISKVKGHVTDDMVASGMHEAQHKDGNDRADAAATEGIGAHGPEVNELFRVLRIRAAQ